MSYAVFPFIGGPIFYEFVYARMTGLSIGWIVLVTAAVSTIGMSGMHALFRAWIKAIDAAQTKANDEATKRIGGGSPERFALYLRPLSSDHPWDSGVTRNPMGAPSSRLDKETLSMPIMAACGVLDLWTIEFGPGDHPFFPRTPTRLDGGDDWLQHVLDLAKRAFMVVVIPGSSKGVLAELQGLRNSGLLDKTIVLIPPKHIVDVSVAREALGASGFQLPEQNSSSGMAFQWSSDGKPTKIARVSFWSRSSLVSVVARIMGAGGGMTAFVLMRWPLRAILLPVLPLFAVVMWLSSCRKAIVNWWTSARMHGISVPVRILFACLLFPIILMTHAIVAACMVIIFFLFPAITRRVFLQIFEKNEQLPASSQLDATPASPSEENRTDDGTCRPDLA